MFENALLRSFFSLIILVAVLGFILYLVKRIARKSARKANSNGIAIISRTSLLPKAHVYIIEAGSQKLLLGVTEQNVNFLYDMTNQTAANTSTQVKLNTEDASALAKELLKKKQPTQQDESLSFSNFLKNTFKKS